MIKSLINAIKGLKSVLSSQPNFTIQIGFAILTVILGFYFELSPTEWALVIISGSLVFVAESFNTAIEYLTDLVSPDFNPLAGRVKDIAAGAVLLACIGAALIGIFIFFPKILFIFR